MRQLSVLYKLNHSDCPFKKQYIGKNSISTKSSSYLHASKYRSRFVEALKPQCLYHFHRCGIFALQKSAIFPYFLILCFAQINFFISQIMSLLYFYFIKIVATTVFITLFVKNYSLFLTLHIVFINGIFLLKTKKITKLFLSIR